MRSGWRKREWREAAPEQNKTRRGEGSYVEQYLTEPQRRIVKLNSFREQANAVWLAQEGVERGSTQAKQDEAQRRKLRGAKTD